MLPDLQARAASLRREDVSQIVYQAEEEWGGSNVTALLRLPCTQIDKLCVVPELQDPGP